MLYQDERTGEIEIVWNSRDGVTPYSMTSRVGNDSRHVHFEADTCAPNHVPSIGQRIFVDLTLERATEGRRRYVERFWDTPIAGCAKMSERWETKEAAVEELSQADIFPNTPDIIVVDEAWLANRIAS
jgi:hypothetical protein